MDESIRKKWRDTVLTVENWPRDMAVARPVRGESKGMWVRSDTTKLLGYLKPTVRTPGRYRAAYEKIAADLAHDAGVNVPPAMLYVRPDATATEERNTLVSLCPSGEIHVWSDLLNGPSDRCKALLKPPLREASGIVAFDAWMGNDDRHNKDNTIYAPDEDRPTFPLDFSNGMDHERRWSSGGITEFKKYGIPSLFKASLSMDIVCAAVDRIQAIDDGVIADVVGRIPPDFLPQGHARTIIDGLVARKGQLCDRLDQWYPA